MRVALDNTFQSYTLDIDGLITSRHRKYLQKIPKKLLSDENSINARTEERGNENQPLVTDTSTDTEIHEGHVTRPDTANSSSSPMWLRSCARTNHAH